MRRKRFLISFLMIACVALGFGVAQGGARARATSINFTATERGTYSCLGPCASATFFNSVGTSQTDSKVLGTMTDVLQGTVVDASADCVEAFGGLDQTENWVFIQKGHGGQNTFSLSTVGDTFCFTADPNVSIETSNFTITGGTGIFAGATGSGSFNETVLTHPQVGYGTFTGTINY